MELLALEYRLQIFSSWFVYIFHQTLFLFLKFTFLKELLLLWAVIGEVSEHHDLAFMMYTVQCGFVSTPSPGPRSGMVF